MINPSHRISEALSYIPVGGHDERVRIAFALKSELGDDGRALWDQWRGDRGSDEADAVWRSASSSGAIRIGTLFHMARQNGWSESDSCLGHGSERIIKQIHSAKDEAAEHEAEIQAERDETARKARAVLERSILATSEHPYLLAKGVRAVETLREIDVSDLEDIIGYRPKSSGIPLLGRLLAVPIKQGHSISTLELIDGYGGKAALTGRGSKRGGYWATSSLPGDDEKGLTFLIGEGVATVLTASDAVGHVGIATLSAGNLKAVGDFLRSRYPSSDLIFLADLDKSSGEPDRRSIEAARACAGKLAVPDFGATRDSRMTDFNDLGLQFGLDAVRSAIVAAKHVERRSHDSSLSESANKMLQEWDHPSPLLVDLPLEPYPIEALPKTIKNAVEEVAGFVKAPISMVASSALAAVSLAVQAHVDIRREHKLEGPVGLYLLTIADSGERKSSCDGYFSRPIREYEAKEAEKAKLIIANYRAALIAWESKQAGLKEKIRQLAKDAKPTGLVESELQRLEREKPEYPRHPRLLYADATPEALTYELAKRWPSAGLMSAEAGLVLGSHGMGKDSVMRNLALLNQLWDGNSVIVDRRSSESFAVHGARLTVALQIQEPTLRNFFERSGELARGTGFLARFLVAWPETTQGTRLFSPPPSAWESLDRFHQRLEAILEKRIELDENGELNLEVLTLSADAKSTWVAFHDAIEKSLARGGELYDIRDVASKSADNAARLAALLTVFESGKGPVDQESMHRATQIVAWHLSESRRFFGELALPQSFSDSFRVDAWLRDQCLRHQVLEIPTRQVQRFGPVRDKKRLDEALNELESLSRIKVSTVGKRRLVLLNPYLLGETK